MRLDKLTIKAQEALSEAMDAAALDTDASVCYA